MIEIRNLVKTYGKVTALDDVSFDVGKGEILGFLGPNGAGKSTAMNIITGYIAPTSGSVIVDGIDVADKPLEVRKMIGYLPEQPPLYGDMTVNEYLNFICDLKSVSQKKRKSMLDDITYIVKIGDVRKRLVRNLSKGYRQRVGFAQALVGDPPILILDEPTVGLDPKQVIEFRRIINGLGRNHTIILSTHILQEVSAVCSDVVIINNGRVAGAGSISDFTSSQNGEKRIVVTFDAKREEAEAMLKTVPQVKSFSFSRVERNSVVFRIVADSKAEANKAVFFAAAEKQIPILEMKTVEKSLEEEFVSIISKDAAGGED
ncbi:MAG: ATP-binding cassette domain-containing protein [Clostridia bacterium]|jgi:ABC-2 type transport system ATP-binding protein|nr:ATP-binding cassette domain-containing protein [Clostridia bacterium]MBP5665394.1 ATP-binding cassette domain-containing protein [Clostridia bacterium]MBP5766431.1 ATP-binding cassette domain-containing protein [Clostridia bacterium]MBR5006704.1 ATP-binding cassette domain-containing protein [Clostridia bacterium]